MKYPNSKRITATLRDGTLERIERSTLLRGLVVRSLSTVARRRGSVDAVVSEAQSGAGDRPLNRTAQMILWATRVESPGNAIPKHFDPATHIESAAGRSAAAAAISRQLASGEHVSSATLRTQLLRLETDRSLRDIALEVEQHVNEMLKTRATRSATGKPGLAPDLQLDIVVDITERLTAAGIRPFLMSGTLLGIIRDGGFMAHDYDIDLGLLPDVDVDEVTEILASSGRYEMSLDGARLVALHPSGARTDLFRHTERDGRWWHSSVVHQWWNTPFELELRSVLGQQLWVPADPELYLDENYGDWQSPVAFYDISFDTPNREYSQTPAALLHLHSRCELALETGDRWLLESAVRALRDHFGVDATRYLAPSPLLDEREQPTEAPTS